MSARKAVIGFAAAAAILSGCAKPADDTKTINAVSEALAAEVQNGSVASLLVGKSVATNFNGGRQFAIAKKVGNVPGEPDCGQFDITVSRPSTRFAIVFGRGDSNWKQNVKVCAK